MIPKNPKTPLGTIPKGKYADYVAALGPAPSGFRYLKVGDRFTKGKDYVLANGRVWDNTCSVGDGPYEDALDPLAPPYSLVCDANWPCITPVPTKRDPKGRFVSEKPAVAAVKYDTGKLKNITSSVNDLGRSVREIDKVLAGDASNLSPTFTWDETEQGHPYWSDRCHGRAKLSESDKDFIRAVRAEFQRRIDATKVVEPKPHASRLETLTKAYAALGKEIEALRGPR